MLLQLATLLAAADYLLSRHAAVAIWHDSDYLPRFGGLTVAENNKQSPYARETLKRGTGTHESRKAALNRGYDILPGDARDADTDLEILGTLARSIYPEEEH